MKMLQNISIRRKQMLFFMLASSATLLLACAAVVAYSVANFRAELVKNTGIMADVIGCNSTAAIDFDDSKAADEALSALRAKQSVIAACVYDRSGKILSTYHREGGKTQFTFPTVKKGGHQFTDNRLNLFQSVMEDGNPVGTIFIASDLQELSAQLKHFAGIVGAVFAGSLLLAFVLSSWLQRLISGPIMHLAQVARAVAADKNYSLRATKQGNDEVGQLIDGFNEMLEQIQERDAHLERRVDERTQDLKRENSERRLAEEAVRESQALYHSLVEHLPAGIYRKDGEGRYVLVNSWFCELRDKTPDEMLQKTLEEIEADENVRRVETQQLNRAMEHHDEIMRTGQPIEMEEQYCDAHGKVRHLHMIKSPVFDANGKVAGSQGIVMDITQLKHAESQLKRERNLLRTLMDKSEDCIYFKDAESRFIRCSSSMCRIFKVQCPEDLVGKRDSDFFSLGHALEAYEDEQRILRAGEPIAGKIEMETWSDGRVTWALTSKMPFHNEAGEITGTFGISKDITAIKEAEEKLGQIHKQLVDASRQAGMAEVATSVLHNVGNVLNSVNVSSSLIADKIRKSKVANLNRAVTLIRAHESDLGNYFSTDPKGKQLPKYLANLAAHLAQEHQDIVHEVGSLVSNVVHIKEIVAMQQNYAKSSGVLEMLNVAELVEDAIRMNTGAMSRHQVEVVRQFADVPPILTEKHKVLQILVNLIRNAKYACDDSGRDHKQIILRVANSDGTVKIAIEDNGIGIASENLTRIFGHGFTTRKEGHGFGLHSGALAAKELGGTLSVASDGHNCGATFTLELPVHRQSKNL